MNLVEANTNLAGTKAGLMAIEEAKQKLLGMIAAEYRSKVGDEYREPITIRSR